MSGLFNRSLREGTRSPGVLNNGSVRDPKAARHKRATAPHRSRDIHSHKTP